MSLQRITELLDKQKLVSGMVHSQDMPRHELVESLLHRQHLAELQNHLSRLSAAEIGGILEALAPLDAEFLWQQVPAARALEILREVADPLRERLGGGREAGSPTSSINAFDLVDGRLRQTAINGRKDLDAIGPLWIDLLKPSKAERAYVGGHFGLSLPDPGGATELEVSSRFRVEDGDEIHLHSNFLLDKKGNSRSVPVIFILHRGILFSIRNEELPVFRLQTQRARAQPGYVADRNDLLPNLYGADVEYSADALEGIYATLDKVGRKVLSEKMSDREAAAILTEIAEEEDLNGRIRSNILDTQRGLSFLIRCKILTADQIEDTRQIVRDIESLNSHTAFLFDKINFLMDATIGFININQNQRVSQLTAFSVVFMPINVLAGIGGMSEFSMMTRELPWPIAYASFIVGMGLVGWAPYVLLKHLEQRKLRQAATTRAS